jgi:DNA-binding SARP family transcriptional activator
VRLRMLGPLEVWADGAWTPVRADKQRALLAILVLHRGQAVDRHRLIDALWDGQPPQSAARLLPHYVWRLRALLPGDGACELRAVPGGYLLAVDEADVDGAWFGVLVEEARAAAGTADVDRAAELLDSALALWRGPALADVRSLHAVDAAAQRLDELRVTAREQLAELWLAQGRYADALAALEELTAAEPYRERSWRLLMLALHRAGRRPEALAAYQRLWRVWTDELGIEPGRELRELHQVLLADSAELHAAEPAGVEAVPDAVPRPGSDRQPRPAQLPAAPADFTGRAAEVADLVDALRAGGLAGATVFGPGGTGKTALAVRVGHLMRPAFPDGQLFVDLRGAQGRPAEPARVLAQFLRALGLAASAVPDSVDERAAMLRSVLADRRVLLLLDNAADETQVRPLLPPAGCAVLVTSRRPLAGLEGFASRRLDVLDPAEATELLGRIAGAARVRAEPADAGRIVTLCGALPLAVRTAGARLAARPHWSLATFVGRLADERRRLDELRAGDLAVRASLGLSYRTLRAAERDALRVAALAPAGDFAAWLIAAGCDVPEPDAEELAETLVDAQLLGPAGLDVAGQARYRLHDLTRVYVLERLAAEERAGWRTAVQRRYLQACVALAVHGVLSADDRVRGLDPAPEVPSRHAGTAALVERDPFAWYDAEHAVLAGAVDQATEHRFGVPAWRLAHALAPFFEARAAWDDWHHTHEVARREARATGQRDGQAAVLSGLGRLELDRGRIEQAMLLLRAAEQLCRSLGLKPLLAEVLQRLGQGSQHLVRHQEGIEYMSEALTIAESMGDRVLRSEALRGFGWAHQIAGRLDEAQQYFSSAIAAVAGTRSRHQLPWLLSDLARVHRDAGRYDVAAAYFERAIAVAEGSGDRRAALHAMYAHGEARRLAGDLETARAVLEAALARAGELRDDHAESLTLRRLGGTYTDLARYQEARACLSRALELARSRGRSQLAAVILLDLGTALARAGAAGEAGRVLEESIAVFRELGLADFQSRAEHELRQLS